MSCKPKKDCPKCKQPPHGEECQCKLKPYSKGCPGGKTPHHLIPDHCFKQPGKDGKYYRGAVEHKDGLSICVTGKDKSIGQHKRIHRKFDAREADLGNKGNPRHSAKLGDLENAAADVASEVTKCDRDDLKKQLRAHHKKRGLGANTLLRADPGGQKTPPPFNKMGTNQATASGAPGS